MIVLLAAAALACDVAESITTLRASGTYEAYVCVMKEESARGPIAAAVMDDPTNPRLSRALALWLLERADTAWDPDLVRLLPAPDRRLIADGVRARRGRKTPAPEHEKVFLQMDWYNPIPGYSDARLTETDRANIAMADKPPPKVEPPPVETTSPPTQPCGCGGGSAFLLFFWSRHARFRRKV